MKTLRIGTRIALVLLAIVLVTGCTISNGVFVGMAQSSTDTSLSVSYISFDGSLAKRVELKAGDEVRFSLEGGEGLQAFVIKGGEQVFALTGAAFTAPGDGFYDFTMKGKAQNGSFTLSWAIERPAADQ